MRGSAQRGGLSPAPDSWIIVAGPDSQISEAVAGLPIYPGDQPSRSPDARRLPVNRGEVKQRGLTAAVRGA